jgi:hypothetical protein
MMEAMSATMFVSIKYVFVDLCICLIRYSQYAQLSIIITSFMSCDIEINKLAATLLSADALICVPQLQIRISNL